MVSKVKVEERLEFLTKSCRGIGKGSEGIFIFF